MVLRPCIVALLLKSPICLSCFLVYPSTRSSPTKVCHYAVHVLFDNFVLYRVGRRCRDCRVNAVLCCSRLYAVKFCLVGCAQKTVGARGSVCYVGSYKKSSNCVCCYIGKSLSLKYYCVSYHVVVCDHELRVSVL